MAKVRVYELARELGKDNKSLEKVIKDLGIEIKNYMSTLTTEQAEVVRGQMGGGKAPAKKKVGVRRRRAAGPRPAEKEREKEAAAAAELAAEAAAEAAAEEAAAPPAPQPTPAPAARPVARRVSEPAHEPAPPPVTRPAAAEPSEAPRPAPAPAPVAAAPRAAAAPRPTAPAPAPAAAPEPEPETETVDAEAPEGPGPTVGQVISLPKNTRRLPGGMADRMKDEPEPAELIETADAPAPETTAEGEPEPKPEGVVGQEILDDDSRVIRNEDGVIVGIRSKQQGPNIKGFISLEPRRQQVIITEASTKAGSGRATRRKQREERAQAQGRKRKMVVRGRGKDRGAAPAARVTAEMREEKKRIRIDEAIQVSDLAHQMGVKAAKVVRILWGMGLRGITINNAIDVETAELIASEFGYSVENVAFHEDEIVGEADEHAGEVRPPVVTMMGHVDHGKTSLLDKIRSAQVADGEAGGITQHVGAYKVSTKQGDVVFLDTPGHEAFSSMRSRGAQLTDIVVLVVAADDGVMPTTIEAIKHSRAASVPMVVAINKVDKPEANAGRAKQMLMEHNLVGEEFGGDTIITEVSAKTGQGIEKLLEMLALQAEVLELRAPTDGRASGTVVEARIDKGRGPIATLLVQGGTLKRGDILVANEASGKVRGIFDDRGKKLKEAPAGTPVEVLGLDGVPSAGDKFNVVESERAAKQLISHRRDSRRRKESVRSGPSVLDLIKKQKTPTFKVVLRGDTQGSVEAVKESLENLSTEKVKVEVIFTGVGAINETDVKFAQAGEAAIFGFNVKPAGKAGQVADTEKVPIHSFNVIYEATDKAKDLMVDLLEPEYREKAQGEAEVRALFPIPRLGTVAGCRVIKGTVYRDSHVRVRREDEVVHEGVVGSLRVFKEDVKEVGDGKECGIVVQGFAGVAPGDIIEAFALETIRPEL
jgi:translation initiation factor IF-2